jgi:hypothetical protein
MPRGRQGLRGLEDFTDLNKQMSLNLLVTGIEIFREIL